MSETPSIDPEEQNYSLQEDIVHLEQLLSGSRLECVEISENCGALSQQLMDCVRSQSEHLDVELRQHQNQSEEEKRLRSDQNRVFIQEQLKAKQFDVVDRLLHRIEEYRTKCARLEAALAKHAENQEALKEPSDTSLQNYSTLDQDAILLRLNHEKKRCQALSQINVYLRNQLEVATDANRHLTDDIEKLTTEWHQTRKEWEEREAEFHREGQSFAEYSIKEQHQYLLARRGMLQLHHDFIKTKDFVRKDLSAMQLQMQHVSHIVPIILSRFQSPSPASTVVDAGTFDSENQDTSQDVLGIQSKHEKEKTALNERIQELLSVLEEKQTIIDEKEGINIALNKTIESLNGKVLGSVSKIDTTHTDTTHKCCKALKEIAQQAMKDLKHRTWLGYKLVDFSDVRKALLSNTPHSVQSLCDSQMFIDGTTTAIENILRQREMQVEKLNAQLIANKDKIKAQQKVVENLDDDKKKLSLLNSTLESQLAAAHATVQDFMKDTHKIQATLEETGSQKSWLEHMRKTLNDQIESLNAENDRLNQAQTSLYQKIEHLQQERDKLKLSEQTAIQDLNRSNKKVSVLETHLEETEKRYRTTEQKLQELFLDKDMLEQEKKDLSASINKLEKQQTDSDAECLKLQTECDALRNSVVSLENINESLSQEKNEIAATLTKMTSEAETAKSQQLREKLEYEQEKQSLKEKLDVVKEKCSDLETEIEKMKSDLQSIEETKGNLEEEKNRVQLEKDELSNQVTKLAGQKKVLDEGLEQVKQEVNFHKESCAKLTREKENLARIKAELEVRAESAETELLHQKQVVEALKGEKEGLEKALYASQQLLNALQDQKVELEDELDNNKSKVEYIQGQLNDLKKQREVDLETFAQEKDALNKKIQQNEDEQRISLQKERQRHKEDITVLATEKDSLRDQFEAAQGELMRQQEIQQDELQLKHAQEIEELKKQMILHEKELQDRMFLSFNEKQKMHSEEECLSQIAELQRTIDDLEKKLREYESKFSDAVNDTAITELHKRTIEKLETDKNDLKEEINSLGTQHEKVVKSLDHRISHLIEEREEALKNVHELQVALEENKVEKNQLEREIENYMLTHEEGNSVLPDFSGSLLGKTECQELEHQNLTLKQKLNSEKSRRETVEKTYEDAKERLKKCQMENTELRSLLQDVRQKTTALENVSGHKNRDSQELLKVLNEVEKQRMEERRTCQAIQRRLNILETQYDAKEREVEETRILMSREEEITGELKSEIMKWKQKAMESNASREANLKELSMIRLKLSDTEHKLKQAKDELNLALQQTFENERACASFEINLQKSLSEIGEETDGLRMKLSAAEGKVTALETKIAKLEGSKRDAESKLHALNLSLRSTLGLGSDSGFQASMPHLFSTPRSSKRGSPMKFNESFGSKIQETTPFQERSSLRESPVPHSAMVSVTELDIDLVKSALQDVLNKLYTTEKERDELKTELASCERRLEQMKENQSTGHLNLLKITKEMNLAQEENKELSQQLSSVKNGIINLEESLSTLQTEKKQLLEKNATILHSVSNLEAEKVNLEASISQLKKFNVQLFQEKCSVTEAREAVESKLLKTETTIRELELEKMELQELASGKKAEIETLEQKLQHLNQSLLAVKQKNESLNFTINNLNLTIEKHKMKETTFLEKVNTLEQTLMASSFDVQTMTKELGLLKGMHTSCELEKSSLENKVENLRSLITDLQQRNQNLRDKVETMASDLKEAEFRKAELEGKVQGYKAILAQNEGLEEGVQEKLRNLEREKYHLEEQLMILKSALKETEEHRITAEREKQRAEKEKSHLKKVYERLQNDKTMTEDLANRSVRERSALGKSLSKMEIENQVLNQKIQSLQAKLAETEQRHLERLKELEQKQKMDADLEIARLRTSKQQLERFLALRSHDHDSVVADLERQLIHLKERMNLEYLHSQPSSERTMSGTRLHAMSSDSLDQNRVNFRQVYVKSVGSNSNIVRATSSSDLTQSAPSKTRQPSTSYNKQCSTPKARKRLDYKS